jgi:diguanylate cyclase (GGDEF)-like protein
LKSLKSKIFVFFVLLLLVVQAIALWSVYSGQQSQERLEIQNRLQNANTIFSELFDSRNYYLTAFATTAAKDFGIKQVFNEDPRSLVVALNNHRKRIDADMVMAISDEGVVKSQIIVERINSQAKAKIGGQVDESFKYPNWLSANDSLSHLYPLKDALYQLSLSPIKVGSNTIGWVGFGFEIDSRLAHKYKNITGLETSFMVKHGDVWKMIASSAKNEQLKLVEPIIKGDGPPGYIVQRKIISESESIELGVGMFALRADLVEVLQGRWWQIIMLIITTLVLSLAGAYAIAASITKPIKVLVEQAKKIASGDYHQQIEIQDQSELGQLANEFNEMQKAVLHREQAMEHLANHDKMTGLPNRNVLVTELCKLSNCRKSYAVFHLNLSRLTEINDTLGHSVGDSLIQDAASKLSGISGISQVFHLGADEFILLSEQYEDGQLPALIVNIDKQLEAPFEHDCLSLQLQFRVGIACFPQHSPDYLILLQMADTALHHTRRRNQQIQIYNSDLEVNTVERLSLMSDFKIAITHNQLEVFYQPKMQLSTELITHMEALVRWRHPSIGLVPPDNFIPIAEQTGQITQLTRWVFSQVVAQYKLWLTQGYDFNLAVNISAYDVRDPDFYQNFCNIIDTENVPANRFTLEVTESAVVDDPDAAIAVLKRFKDKGFKLSIDDYGTGYSSLAQLKQLPVHELKIDKSFIQKLKEDPDDQIIVLSTIELAHNMGLTIVAEGIEDEFALDWLRQRGCEKAQGYFINRPQPIAELNEWLKKQKTEEV